MDLGDLMPRPKGPTIEDRALARPQWAGAPRLPPVAVCLPWFGAASLGVTLHGYENSPA